MTALKRFIVEVPDTPSNRAAVVNGSATIKPMWMNLEGVTVSEVPASEFCQCDKDWTDGTAYCQECHKPRAASPETGEGDK